MVCNPHNFWYVTQIYLKLKLGIFLNVFLDVIFFLDFLAFTSSQVGHVIGVSKTMSDKCLFCRERKQSASSQKIVETVNWKSVLLASEKK